MSENMLSKVTDWSWASEADPTEADKALHYLAHDHALLLAAITSGDFDLVREWGGDKNETLTSLRVHSIASGESVVVALDPFGAPLLTPELRAAIKYALGIKP